MKELENSKNILWPPGLSLGSRFYNIKRNMIVLKILVKSFTNLNIKMLYYFSFFL